MKRLLIILALLSAPALGQTTVFRIQKFCELGGQRARLQGLASTNEVQRSFPNCTVTVYNSGTVTLSTIYSDNLSTPTSLANPFTAANDGSFGFWAQAACYDVVTSAGNTGDQFPSPFTYYNVCIGNGGSGGGGGGGSGGTVLSVGLAAPTGIQISGSPVTVNGTLTWGMPSGWTTGSLLLGNAPNSVSTLGIGANGTALVSNGSTASWSTLPFMQFCAGTTNQVIKFTNGPNGICGDSSGSDDGTNPTQWPKGLSVMSSAGNRVLTNATPATTVLYQLVQRDSSGNAINATTSTSRAIGIAGQGAALDGLPVQVVAWGYTPCVFDGQTVVGDFAAPSTSVAGLCADVGSVRPAGVEIVGTITTLNSGSATTAIVDMFTGDTLAAQFVSTGTINPCGSAPGPIAYYTGSNTLDCDTSFTTDGSGNFSAKSGTFSGTGAGFIAFTQSTAPTLSLANSIYLAASTSIASTFQLTLPTALGTASQCLGLSGVSGSVGTLAFQSCSGGGGGTVTSFSAGTLSPLFTTSVATSTTTPALSFILTNAAGGTVFGNTSASAAAPAYTSTPVLGIAGTTMGTLAFKGSTSGTVSLTPQATAGTPTLTFPNASGTFGVSASSPLVLNSTTGDISCPTCGTSGGVTGQAYYPNEGVTGTVTNQPVKFSNYSVNTQTVIKTQAADNARGWKTGVIGVCVSGCGTTGSALIAFRGMTQCTFEAGNTPTKGDFVEIGTTGKCLDDALAGFNEDPQSHTYFAKVHTTAGAGATTDIDLIPLGAYSSGQVGGAGPYLASVYGGGQFASVTPAFLSFSGGTATASNPAIATNSLYRLFSQPFPSFYYDFVAGSNGSGGADLEIDLSNVSNTQNAFRIACESCANGSPASHYSPPEIKNVSTVANQNDAVADTRKWTLTGNGGINSFTLAKNAGHISAWRICQDGTGGRTFTWESTMLGATVPNAASACMTQMFMYDGTNYSPVAPATPVTVVSTGQTAAISTTTLAKPVANSTYRVTANLSCTTSSASATVNITIAYTDVSNTAQTKTMSSAVDCTTLGASSVGDLHLAFRAKASTSITYATAIVNTPTYDLSLALETLTSN